MQAINAYSQEWNHNPPAVNQKGNPTRRRSRKFTYYGSREYPVEANNGHITRFWSTE